MPSPSALPSLSDTDAQLHLHPLRQILSHRSLSTHLQPIVSIKAQALVGVEALTRASDPTTGQPVSPVQLFGWARELGLLLELDQLCQASALAAFASLPSRDPELLLFMNVEASLLDEQPGLSLLQAARRAGVDPGSVVLEVNEAQVHSPERLRDFVQRHREQGFLTAMDDLGSGHSSLQRWPLLRPDVIKLDRALVDGVAGSFYAQELLRSLIALGRQTGALILAEGVETAADVTTCLDLGVDLFQGYYFARPAAEPFSNLDQALERARACAASNKVRHLERMALRRAEHQRHRQLALDLAEVLGAVQAAEFSAVMQRLDWDRCVQTLWVLDADGQQVSATVSNHGTPRAPRASLFQPPKAGSDHSGRDYYYGLMEAGLERDCYVTEVHVSSASGRPCRTLSYRFTHPDGQRYLACLELGLS